MFSDPLTLTAILGINNTTYLGGSSAQSFVCTGRTAVSSTYRWDISSSHWCEIFIGHQYGRRNRYTVRFTESELVADPIDTTKNSVKSSTMYVVCDRSLLGAGTNEDKIMTMLGSFLLSRTDEAAFLKRVLAGET